MTLRAGSLPRRSQGAVIRFSTHRINNQNPLYPRMVFARSENLKAVDSRWHINRQKARENAFSIDEFSDEEIIRYDLDTAKITGRDNPRTYRMDPTIDMLGVGGLDVRTLDDR